MTRLVWQLSRQLVFLSLVVTSQAFATDTIDNKTGADNDNTGADSADDVTVDTK